MENNKPKLRPVIKWTGGKYDEFQHFAHCIPPFRHYYEPFFGGGGVFFALQPGGKAFVNDQSHDLIQFYKRIGKPDLQQALELYCRAWAQSGQLAEWLVQRYLPAFAQGIGGSGSRQDAMALATRWINKVPRQQFAPLLEAGCCVEPPTLVAGLIHSLGDKMLRIRRICQREQRIFAPEEQAQHLTTAVKGAFYLHLRHLHNHANSYKHLLSPAQVVAIWYFVRELCYGSMFRYNAAGAFNIPYGGIAYNSKNMAQKVQGLQNPDLLRLLRKARFSRDDFESFLQKHPPEAEDFIFLDPPYDTEFSSYDNHAFTPQDQQRLCACLVGQQAKWLLIIKDTPFIRQLYKGIGAHMSSFEKQYTYNVRGRNDRAVQHLIISNYDTRHPGQPARLQP